MKEKVYTPRQVLAASIFGGPVGGVYALSKNVSAGGNPNDVLALAMFGWVPIALFLAAAPFLPTILAIGLLTLAYAGPYAAARHWKTEKALSRRAVVFEYFQTVALLRNSALAMGITIASEAVWVSMLWDQLS